MMRSTWAGATGRVIVGAIVGVAAATNLAGCGGAVEQLAEVRSELDTVRQGLEADLAEWDRRLAEAETLSQTDPASAGALAAQAGAERAVAAAQAAAVEAAARQVDLVLDEANNPADPIAKVVGWIAPWLPEPLRTPLTLGAALAAVLARGVQLKRGMASIARGIQKALDEDAEFAARFRGHAATFRSSQTPAAARVVDEATRDGFMVRLPI